MKQHFKGIIWPHGPREAKVKQGRKTVPHTVYHYVVVGVLVTDEPVAEFEGRDELLLDGPVNALAEPFTRIKSRKPKLNTGDANNVLHHLILL